MNQVARERFPNPRELTAERFNLERTDKHTDAERDRIVECPFCEREHEMWEVGICEGRYIVEELGNYPSEIR
jgi:hypothetical protein